MLGGLLVVALLGCRSDADPRPGPRAAGSSAPLVEATTGGNVLVLLVDDLGVDQLELYGIGSDPPPTPAIDRLASEGVTFRHAWAYPSCSPGRAALLTGRHARRAGIGEWIEPITGTWSLRDEEVTIPEILPATWQTALLGKWHLSAYADPQVEIAPLLQGFDHFAGSLANLGNQAGDWGPPRDYFRWEKDVDGELSLVEQYATTDTVEDALTWVSTARAPWFLMVSFNAPHGPLHVPPAELTGGLEPARARGMYEASVVALDTELGRLLDGLPDDVRADTTIVFLSDNGTPDHGISPPLDPAHGKETAWELGVRVPLIVAGPHVDAPGATSDALVHVVDVLPTVAEIAGVAPPPHDGLSLLPLLRDPELPGHEVLFTETFGPNGPGPYTWLHAATRDHRFKLLWDGASEELYALDGRGLETGPDLLPNPPLEAVKALGVLRAELDLRLGAELE